MIKEIVSQKINIVKFVHSEKSELSFETMKELIKEGNVCKFYLIYTNDKDNDKMYKSKCIRKLNLYEKMITTEDGKYFEYENEIA